MKRWYIIEGNIGSGKSTVVDALSKDLRIETIQEPVDVWESIKDDDGKSLLDMYYQDPKRFCYLFQTITFKTRMQSLDFEQQKDIRVSERSIMTDKNIFMKCLDEMGYMSAVERNSYYIWYDWLQAKMNRRPDAIIYIRADPETCLKRICHRNRTGESNISLDYLQTLHNKHEEWLNSIGSGADSVPVYIIDNPLEMDKSELVKRVKDIVIA